MSAPGESKIDVIKSRVSLLSLVESDTNSQGIGNLDGWVKFRCPHPDHADRHPSFSCRDGGGFKCHSHPGENNSGGSVIDYWIWKHDVDQQTAIDELFRIAEGGAPSNPALHKRPKARPDSIVPPAEPIPEDQVPRAGEILRYRKENGRSTRFTPDHVYRYRHADTGAIECLVLRRDPAEGTKRKQFRPLRLAKGEFWSVAPEEPRGLYGAEKIGKAKQVIIVEGEKAADAAQQRLGEFFAVLTWPGGSNAVDRMDRFDWTSLYGKSVVLFPDNDQAGRRAMRIVGGELTQHGGRIKIVDSTDLPPKGDAADVPPADDLRQWMAGRVSTFDIPPQGQLGSTRKKGERPAVIFNIDQDAATEEVVNLLLAEHGGDEPDLFRNGERLIRLIATSAGTLCLLEPNKPRTQILCDQIARFADRNSTGNTFWRTPPDAFYAKSIEALIEKLPRLDGISASPILHADGSLVTQEGYDTASHLYYAPPKGFGINDLPQNPTAEDIRNARKNLEEPFVDFPFEDESSLTHAMMLLFTKLMRHLIDGPVPAFLIDARKEGTGKSLLVEIAMTIAEGNAAPGYGLPETEAEIRKVLSAMYKAGDAVAFFDNVGIRISSSAIAKAITCGKGSRERLLGASDSVDDERGIIMIFTANNIGVSSEIHRRGVYVQLKSRLATPSQRSGFKIPGIQNWVTQERPQLLWSALLIASTALKSRPAMRPEVPEMGSFEAWRETMNWVCETAGWTGLLANSNRMREKVDRESAAVGAMLYSIYTYANGHLPFSARDIRREIDPSSDASTPLRPHVGDFPMAFQNALAGRGRLGDQFSKILDSTQILWDGTEITLRDGGKKTGNVSSWFIEVKEPEH